MSNDGQSEWVNKMREEGREEIQRFFRMENQKTSGLIYDLSSLMNFYHQLIQTALISIWSHIHTHRVRAVTLLLCRGHGFTKEKRKFINNSKRRHHTTIMLHFKYICVLMNLDCSKELQIDFDEIHSSSSVIAHWYVNPVYFLARRPKYT